MAKAKQVDVIVVRGEVVVAYTGEPVYGVNDRGQKVVVSMGDPVSVGPGGRITLDADEADKLLARGIVRIPATDNDLPAPVSNMPRAGVMVDDGVRVTDA